MSKDKVRIGVIGSKFAADFHADSYKRNDKVELVGPQLREIIRQAMADGGE